MTTSTGGRHRVVVVGGGFGGATAAKYIKRLDPAVHVTLIEPAQRFYTCPFSNLYLAGWRDFESLGHGYDELAGRYGVEIVHQLAEDVDAQAHTVRLADGRTLRYDKLVLSPGIDIRWDALEGYDEAAAERAPHAWKAGDVGEGVGHHLGAGLYSRVPGCSRRPPAPADELGSVQLIVSRYADSAIELLPPVQPDAQRAAPIGDVNLYPSVHHAAGSPSAGIVHVNKSRTHEIRS
jgi:hypothetical protein